MEQLVMVHTFRIAIFDRKVDGTLDARKRIIHYLQDCFISIHRPKWYM